MLPASVRRVPDHTSESSLRAIEHRLEKSVAWYAQHPDQIDQRLAELDREWDVERTLEANAATLAFVGTALGALVHRGFLILPAVVTAFLFQHALQGWCPPLPILRRAGFRTPREIEAEWYALKALRGDFDNISTSPDPAKLALHAVRR